MRNKLIIAFFSVTAAAVSFAADKTFTASGGPYTVNSTAQPILTLVRGKSYLFNAAAVTTTHPFKLTTNSVGGSGTTIYTNNVAGAQPVCSGGGPCQATTFIFSPDSTTPDTLYYECNVHQNYGNQIRVVNPPAQTSASLLTNGLIGITFTNAYSTTAAVQRATDLFSNNWFTIQTITTAPGGITITVTNDLPVQHFRITTPLP